MKKLSKAILLALGAALILGVFALFCVNLYLQSPGTQEQIQAQLSRALHMPLKITNTSLSPWSGVRVAGITIPQGDTNFLEAGSFTADYRFLPLLAGRLVIPEMTVDRPKVVWRQDEAGKWRLPALEKPAAVGEATAAAPAAKKGGGLSVEVERFLVKRGAVTLVDKDGKNTATFTDVEMTYTSLTGEKIEGTAVIARVVWAETLALENVRTPFKYAAGEFTLPDVTGTLGGGPVRGSYRAQPDASKSPFETVFTFEQVNLDRVAIEAGWKPGQVGGLVGGKIALHGDMSRAERAEGTGNFQLRDGQLSQLEFFQTIGQALNIRELSDLRLKDAHGDFHIAGEKVLLDQLTLNALNLQLGAKGYVRFDKKVALDAQLAVDGSLVKQLPDLVRESFATTDSGQRTIDFNITGTTDKLRTNLLDKLIGQKINQQLDNVLTSIFGGGSKEDDRKKKEEDERKKEEKKRKKEKEKAAAQKAAGDPGAAPAPPAAPAAPTTAITPVKP